MPYVLLRRPLRARPVFFWLLPFELAGVVANLVLTAISQPDTYRTTLWKIGFNNQLNSNPAMILYAYANHKPLPHIPFVWSQTLTDFNVAISVLSLFVLITKMICLIMHVYFPVIGVFVALAMAALFSTSLAGQAGSDYADSRYPSSSPWYLRMGCDLARPYGAYTGCRMTQGEVAAAAYLLAIYTVALVICIWSMLPNPAADAPAKGDSEDGSKDGRPASRRFPWTRRKMQKQKQKQKQKQWEMQTPGVGSLLSPVSMTSAGGGFTPAGGGFTPAGGGFPAAGGGFTAAPSPSPFTPRTQAFHALERKLPLRR